jgi:hypothetical protein
MFNRLINWARIILGKRPRNLRSDDASVRTAEEQMELESTAAYERSLDVLDNVVRDCIVVSQKRQGVRVPSTKHFYASVLFTALISRGVSLAILAPDSVWSNKLIEHWDYASAAMIVRSMMEIRAAFHYLCVDTCSDEEWQCRWQLLNLHDCISRRRLFSESSDPDAEELDGFASQAEELRERLRRNSHFTKLPRQKHLLNGQTAYIYPLEDILEKAGLEKRTYRYLNVLFSSAVHGLPMSYYRMGEQERGRGLPSPVEKGYTSMCHSLAATLLVRTRDEIEALFGVSPGQDGSQ